MGVPAMDFILAENDNCLDPDSGILGFARNFKGSSSGSLQGPTFLSRL
jgi:hypothetical protein